MFWSKPTALFALTVAVSSSAPLLAQKIEITKPFEIEAVKEEEKKEQEAEALARLSTLTFKDGTEVRGTLSEFSPGTETLRFSSPDLTEPADLLIKGLLNIDLGRDEKSDPPSAEHIAVATSKPRYEDRPRDTFHGQLEAIGEKTIVLNTWYAGKLELERKFIGSLELRAGEVSIFQGPSDWSAWIAPSGRRKDAWALRNRRLIATAQGGIAREVKIPAKARISFRAAWQRQPGFQFIFLSTSGKNNYPPAGYRLYVQNGVVSLNRTSPDSVREDVISSLPLNLDPREKSARIDIYLDRELEGQNALYINNRRIGGWTHKDDTKGMGNFIHFITQRQEILEISEILVQSWNGNLPGTLVDTKEAEGPGSLSSLEGEHIGLANGDSLVGQIKTIENGQLLTTTPYGNLKLPLTNIREINVAGPVPDEPQPKLLPRELRAWFHEGGFIHMRLEEFDGTHLTGSSQVFGRAKFDLKAFSRLEFNVWRPELDLVRYGQGLSQP